MRTISGLLPLVCLTCLPSLPRLLAHLGRLEDLLIVHPYTYPSHVHASAYLLHLPLTLLTEILMIRVRLSLGPHPAVTLGLMLVLGDVNLDSLEALCVVVAAEAEGVDIDVDVHVDEVVEELLKVQLVEEDACTLQYLAVRHLTESRTPCLGL